MKKYAPYLFALLWLLTANIVSAQQFIRGKVVDAESGQSLLGVTVAIPASSEGTVTNLDGEFMLNTGAAYPFTLMISYSDYAPVSQLIQNDASILIKLERAVNLRSVEIIGTMNTEAEHYNLNQRSTYDTRKIENNPTANLLAGIALGKDFDGVTGSLAMTTINARGFNTVAPVRMLQLIDGVDNQSPGLNFSLGNFLGASELDLLKVELVVGASSSFFGPNAFNGVISMVTRDPFIHEGLSVMMRAGERNLTEGAIRFAKAYQNAKQEKWFAFKVNLYALRAQDWRAENYQPVDNSRVSANNPGRYDAVNIYGDEYNPEMNFADSVNLFSNPGLGNFYRTGYKEADLVDYDTRNYKGNAAFYFRLKPGEELYSPQVILATSFGSGTTIYQGDNRFSLRNILFMQHKMELVKRDHYFVRAYYTHENAGQSYDPYFTALRLLDQEKGKQYWKNDYAENWVREYYPKMCALGYPKFMPPIDSVFDYAAAREWLITYNDSMQVWHNQNAIYANDIHPGNPPGTTGYLIPGTESFNTLFKDITGRLNNENKGTRFYDHSALFHMQGEYIFRPKFLDAITTGASYRRYAPKSQGTLFYDTLNTVIHNSEFGWYAGAKRSFLKNKNLQASATLRLDKNENFKWVSTYAAGFVYHPDDITYIRISASSALRNPSLTDQYLWLNVGPAILAGHVQKVDSLITLESFDDFRNTLDLQRLSYFSVPHLRPEFVSTLEAGLRTTLFKKVFLDATYYTNKYQHFLGYIVGLTSDFHKITNLPYNTQVFRYTSNASGKVTTQGFSMGIEFPITNHLSFRGNYSFNELKKSDRYDPIIPAYNTPRNKFNIGLAAQNAKVIRIGSFTKSGLMFNYKWVQSFVFEGSPQYTGTIPAYGVVDAQFNLTSDQWHTMIKIGASNLLNQKHFETYGGPMIGRLAYVQVLYQFHKS